MKREAEFPPSLPVHSFSPRKNFYQQCTTFRRKNQVLSEKLPKESSCILLFPYPRIFFAKNGRPKDGRFPILMESLWFYEISVSSQSSLTRNALFKGIRLSIFFFRCQSPLFLFFTLRTSLQISTNGMTVNASATAMKYSFALMAANSKAVLMPGT